MYEQRKWSNTYLLISEDGMQQKPMKLIVEGYFTLSNKVICIDDAVSNSTRKKIFGGILKENQYIHTILIGQLGKYIEDKYSSSLSMNELLFFSCVFGNESYIVPEKSVLRDFSLQNVRMSNRQTVLSQGLHLQEMLPEKEDLVINRIIPVL